MYRMKRYLKMALILVATIGTLLIVGYITLLAIVFSPIERQEFDSDIWKSGTNRAHGRFPRQRMVDSIIENNALFGKSKEEILSLLGKPDSSAEINVYSYFTGPARRIGSADNEYIKITFNSSGAVVKCILYIQ